MSNKVESAESEAKGAFDLYVDHAKNLRLWLVSYGVGVPFLFATQAEVRKSILDSGQARGIVVTLLVGVALQIFTAAINKWSAWYTYDGLGLKEAEKSWVHTSAEWVSDQFWFDVLSDFGTLLAFGWATVAVLRILGA